MKTLDVTLYGAEIQFLGELLQIELIVGMKDPHEHLSQQEKEASFLEARDSLIKNQILFERDTYEIERSHAVLIDAMRPQFTYCRVQHIAERKQSITHYHFTPMLAIKRTELPNSTMHRIQLVGTPADALKEIKRSFPVPQADTADTPLSFTLEEEDFKRLTGPDKYAAREELKSSYDKETTLGLDAFTSSITTPLTAGQVERIVWDEKESKWHDRLLHFIIGKAELWKVSPTTGESVQMKITKIGKSDLEQSIDELGLFSSVTRGAH